MCGLFASAGFTPDEKRIDIVAHRGPDGRGWQVKGSQAGPVALGHRRLAIIDLSDDGAQPMLHEPSGLSLVFNGEIYNFLELRAELEATGEHFATRSDSEVLLRAFAVWGESALDRLRGMFAFVIHDARRQRLFAARDRFGIKPLYYAQTDRGIAFASEIKQLLGLEGLPTRMNLPRVHDFLASGIMDHTDETLFAGVRQLRAGECAAVDLSRARPTLTVRRWYPVTVAPLAAIDEDEAAERFRQLLDESVDLHLRSDVPVGSCLSGGLDSSSLVCLMADKLRGMPGQPQVRSVSACYDDRSVDEKPFVDIVAAHAGAQSNIIYPRHEDVFDLAGRMTWHQDEPFGSTSIFAQWSVFAEARRLGVKVMLDGQGADEQLAGYHSAFHYYGADLLRSGHWGMLARMMLERKRWHGAPLGQQARNLLLPLLPPALKHRLRGGYRTVAEHGWLDSDIFRQHAPAESALDSAARSIGLEPPRDIASLCHTLTHASNLQMLLHWEDRSSMAHSIEARVPFLDHRLVEFSLGLGNQHKIVGGDTKRVLRAAMAGILPEAVRQRRDKLGFATPETLWFRGPLKPLVLDAVEQCFTLAPGLLNEAGTRALVDDMLSGRSAVDFRLWRLVNLAIWVRQFNVAI
jgi:asparagine synthase (glutamine-hydrolysing)